MTDPKSAGDGGEVKRWDFAEAEDAPMWRFNNGRFVRFDDHAAALAEAKQEAADNEADYQGLARLIEEAGYPHLRAMIQALEEAKEFSRRDNQMAAMAEIKIAEARKRAEAAEENLRQQVADTERLLRARLTCITDAVKQDKPLHLIQAEVSYWATCEREIIERAAREIDAAREDR